TGGVVSTPISFGSWVHVAGTYEPSPDGNLRLFVNGREMARTPYSAVITHDPTVSLAIGGNYASNVFQGSMDEVRIWGVRRTQTQIRDGMHDTDYAGGSDLKGYWKMDDALCNSAPADSSGNGNVGFIFNYAVDDWDKAYETATAPLGPDGKFLAATTPASVGP